MGLSARKSVLEALRRRLSLGEFEHSLRVEATAGSLAGRFGIDRGRAELAGLLHDYARSLPPEELLRLAQDFEIPVGEAEKQVPYLVHAPVGAALVRQDFGITDSEVLQAIQRHTVGEPGMCPLDKLIYVSDLIEPERLVADIEPARQAAESDLDESFALAYAHVLRRVIDRRRVLHPQTVLVWNEIVGK